MKKRGKIKKRVGRPSGSKNKKPKPPPADPDEAALMTAHEVADYLHCDYFTVINLSRQGRIPGLKLGGGNWRFLKSELDKWIAKQELRPPPAPERKRPR
jgi:excisionase family DNA binding protein